MAKGVSYLDTDIRFVNPYNFVPVDFKKKGERIDVTQKKDTLLTGYLDCKLRCRTPLAIPDTQSRETILTEENEKHYKYPFYRAGRGEKTDMTTAVIPGSSLRGVIRSVYETLTDSCFGTMRKDTMITIRVNNPFLPGLLIREKEGKKEKWNLYSAKRWLLPMDKAQGYRMGEIVSFKPSDVKNIKNKNRLFVSEVAKQGKYGNEGYYCAGEFARTRKYYGIFVKPEGSKPERTLKPEDFNRLESTLAVYRNDAINLMYESGENPHHGYKDYEIAKENGVIPIYYAIDEQRDFLYLSFAAIGRKAFHKTLNEAVQNRAPQKCISRKNLCPACALFGTMEKEQVGSRVRITDALCDDFTSEYAVFEELSSPKISYVPFYLRERGHFVNYAAGYDSDNMEVRGRKYYWHHMPAKSGKVKLAKRNATFEVIKEGAEFRFRIYFDGITDTQLCTLEEAVHMNDNQLNGNQCHKIGHGKSLGYGSVKIAIESCVLRSFDAEHGWKETAEEIHASGNAHTCDDETYRMLMMISDFRTAEKFGRTQIMYPKIIPGAGYIVSGDKASDNNLAAYNWFMQNYSLGNKKPKKVLPEIKDEIEGREDSVLKVKEARKVTGKSNFNKPKQDHTWNQKNKGNSKGMAFFGDSFTDKSYEARVISSARNTSNKKVLEYDIEIKDQNGGKKKAVMTALINEKISRNDTVKVEKKSDQKYRFVK